MAGRLKRVASRRILVAALIGTALSLTVRAQRFLPPARQITVVDAMSGRPIGHAMVTTLAGRSVAFFLAGRDGRVRVENSVRYNMVDAYRPGYDATGTTANDRDFNPLTIRLRPEAVLSGRVLDRHGAPVVQAVVKLIRVPAQGATASNAARPVIGSTDDRGVFRLSVFAAHYLISVTEPDDPSSSPARLFDLGADQIQTTARAVESYERSMPFELLAGQERSDVIFRLPVDSVPRPPGAVISGVVTDEAGLPMAHTTIRVLPASRMDSDAVQGSGARVTDSRGAFRVWGLPPGTYYVLAQRQPSQIILRRDVRGRKQTVDFASTYWPNADLMLGARPIVLAGSQEITDVNIRMPIVETAPVTVMVAATNDTVLTSSVTLIQDPDGGAISGAAAQGTGASFTFPNVRRGRYRVIGVARVANAPESSGQAPLQWGSTEIDVVPGRPNDSTVAVAWGVSVSGRVVSDGILIPPALRIVRLVPRGSFSALGHYVATPSWGFTLGGPTGFVEAYDAEADGRFVMPSVPPGEYVVEWTGPRGWRATSATLNGRDVLRAPFVVGDRNIADIVITVTNR